MLILNPKEGESITVGEQVHVTYLGENKKGEPMIGFSAPKSMNIKFLHPNKEKPSRKEVP